MKKIIVVIVAAAVLLGIGYSFMTLHFGGTQPSSASAAAGKSDLVDANGHAKGEAVSNEPANMNPENDGSQFKASNSGSKPESPQTNPKLGSISFEGAELPQGDQLGRNKHGVGGKNANGTDRDLKFAPLEDNTDVVGKPYFPHGELAKHKAIKAVPDHVNDDLLIMEGRSEDRIVTAGSK